MLAGQIELVDYFDTWTGGIIPSTDPAGLAYHPFSDHLLIADSEISELSLFTGQNVFEVSRSGDQTIRGVETGNSEPTGITYNERDGFFYVTNDDDRTITRYDASFSMPLATVHTRRTDGRLADPEGITSDPEGNLYAVFGHGGGHGTWVAVFDTDLQLVRTFPLSAQMSDAEGIAYNRQNQHLYMVSSTEMGVFEYSLDGQFVESYSLDGFQPAPRTPQGLTFAPTSNPDDHPAALALYIADGGRDNFPDGRVYEALVPIDLVVTDDHGDHVADATPGPVPAIHPGVLETGGDVDYFAFSGTEGMLYQVATSLGTLADSTLTLVDASGQTLAADDDSGPGPASLMQWIALSDGIYFVRVAAYDSAQTGSYLLTIDGGPPTAGQIRGQSWQDTNGNGRRDAEEPGLAGRMLFLDLNADGRLDTLEPIAISQQDNPQTEEIDEQGRYTFTGVWPGNYLVRELVLPGERLTTPLPTAGTGKQEFVSVQPTLGVSPQWPATTTLHTAPLVAAAESHRVGAGSWMAVVPSGGAAEEIDFGSRTIGPGGANILVVSADAGGYPLVRMLDAATRVERFSLLPYDARFRGGVRVATADFTGDGVVDIVTAAGPGGGPHVRVFDGASGMPLDGLLGNFFAYDIGYTGGVWVAAGDIDGDGRADVVTGADAGGGPHVRVFSGRDGSELGQFFPFALNFAGGVRVAVGDVDGDGLANIVTAAGPGGGPHVRVFVDSRGSELAGLVGGFYAFSPNFFSGVHVTTADVDGDGIVDIVSSAGTGGGPHVRAFRASDLVLVAEFYPYSLAFRGGVRVAGGDLNGNGRAELITVAGPGGSPHTRIFDGSSGSVLAEFYPFEETFAGGLFIAIGSSAEYGLTDPETEPLPTEMAADPLWAEQVDGLMQSGGWQ